MPDALAALGYDAAMVARRRDRARGRHPGGKIRDAIAETKDFPGVTGKITLDENRNATKAAVVLEVGKGASTARYAATIKPLMGELLQQLINGLAAGAIYALIALGYTMVYGVLKLINFAHGDVFMVGAMGYGRPPSRSAARTRRCGPSLLIFLAAMAACARHGLPHRALRLPAAAARRRGSPRSSPPSASPSCSSTGSARLFGAAAQSASPRAFPEVIAPREWLVIGDRAGSDLELAGHRRCSSSRSALMLVLQFSCMRTRFGRAMRAVSFDAPGGGADGHPRGPGHLP